MLSVARIHLPLRHRLAVVLVLVALFGVARLVRQQQQLPGPVAVASDDAAPVEVSEQTTQEEAQPETDSREQQILGVWQQEKFGRRTLTILPDGKARMLIEPAGAWSLAFGKQIEAEMFWKLEDDRIIYGMTSGTPANKYEIAVKAWGDHWNEQLTELSAERLVVTADDGAVSIWQRVPAATE